MKTLVLLVGVFLVNLVLCVPTVHSRQLKVQVEEVYIVIDVRTLNGDSIDGLTAMDFTVTQNGVSVPVRGIEIQNKDIPREGPAVFPIILCNKGCLTLDKLINGASALISLFQKEDRAALYLMCPEPRLLAPFTGDFDALKKALLEIHIEASCVPKITEMVTMAVDDTLAFKGATKEHRRIMPVLAGDNMPFSFIKSFCATEDDDGNQSMYPCDKPVLDGPEFDHLLTLLRDNEIKFFDISNNNQPQMNLAIQSGGESISAQGLAGGFTTQAIAALKQLRTKNVPANRYTLMFTPVVIEGLEKDNISVMLGPQFGTPEKDYSLIVQRPCVRTATDDCKNIK